MTIVLADLEAVPEIIDPVATADNATGGGSIYWSAPRSRSPEIYGAEFWTANALGSFVGAKVNDGELLGQAFTWKDGAGDSSLVLDLGAGNAVAMRECHFSWPDPPPAGMIFPWISFSDDAAAWTAATGPFTPTTYQEDGAFTSVIGWPGWPGARRAWRFERPPGQTLASAFNEVWFRAYGDELTGEVTEGLEFVLRERPTFGTASVVSRISGANRPTSTNPLSLRSALGWQQPGSQGKPRTVGGAVTVAVALRTRQGLMKESRGVEVLVADFESRQSTIALATGNNDDITVTGEFPLTLRITGPGGAFATRGFLASTGAYDGDEFFVHNPTAHAWTVTHNDAGSSSGSRTLTRTAANIAIAAGGHGRFKKVVSYGAGALTGWLLELAADSTGYK